MNGNFLYDIRYNKPLATFIVAYAGAQSSAKTTTVNRLARLFTDTGISHVIIPEVARACPFEIGKGGGYITEMWILEEQIRREKEAMFELQKRIYDPKGIHFIILDRAVYDCAVYARALFRQGKMTKKELAKIESVIDDYRKTDPYDLLYLCEPKPIIDDGVRDTDPKWQDEIYTEYKRYVKEKGLNFTIIQ